jgi:hypothetical protein
MLLRRGVSVVGEAAWNSLSRTTREGYDDTNERWADERKDDEAARRRVIAIGSASSGRWEVRTSLWRYLAATALSSQ